LGKGDGRRWERRGEGREGRLSSPGAVDSRVGPDFCIEVLLISWEMRMGKKGSRCKLLEERRGEEEKGGDER